jgi:hypothetical protein
MNRDSPHQWRPQRNGTRLVCVFGLIGGRSRRLSFGLTRRGWRIGVRSRRLFFRFGFGPGPTTGLAMGVDSFNRLRRLFRPRGARRFFGDTCSAFALIVIPAAVSVVTGAVAGFTRAALRQQGLAPIVAAQLLRFVFVNRAGVRDLLSDLEFVELVDDLARLHFQLPRQFIDSNLTHIKVFRLTACSSHCLYR